jgi:DNA-binding IclR family transcriptional regulator
VVGAAAAASSATAASGTSGAGADPVPRSVTIALDLIESFGHDAELPLTELARRVHVAKSTASRTCSVLVARGILERTDRGWFRLGAKLMEYGNLAKLRHGLSTRARLILTDVRDAVGETVQMAVPAGADVLYVERVEAKHSLRYTGEGYRYSPVHRSSNGKVLAAWNPELARARLAAGLPASTGYTIVVPELFVAELERIRSRGYATSVEESELGGASIAVPVWKGARRRVVASLGIAGPTRRVMEPEVHHVAVLRAAADRLGQAITSGEISLPAVGVNRTRR